MFMWRYKKNINNIWSKNAPYMELWAGLADNKEEIFFLSFKVPVTTAEDNIFLFFLFFFFIFFLFIFFPKKIKLEPPREQSAYSSYEISSLISSEKKMQIKRK